MKRPLYVRVVALLLALVAAWHIAASFLWIAPPTPLRDLVPGNLLTQYMIPWFGQSWSVFAPAPINGDYRLSVRAVVHDADGTEHTTKWVSATDVEQSMLHHNFFPPRASALAVHQASLLKTAWEALTPEQQKIAQLNYFKGDSWLGRMQVAMNDSDAQKNIPVVTRYIVQERYTAAYATQVAKAVWGDGATRVQFAVSRQNIIPFAERHNPHAERPPVQNVPTGWRGEIVLPSQSEADFRSTFLAHWDGHLKTNP